MADMDSVHFGPVIEEGVSQVTATPSVKLGTRRLFAGEEYVYAYNAGNVQVGPRQGVRIATTSSGYSFDGATGDHVFQLALGVVKHATFATATYGWVMTKGFTGLQCTPNSTITGDFLPLVLRASGCFFVPGVVTSAVDIGSLAVCAFGLNVNTASGGVIYGMVKTGF